MMRLPMNAICISALADIRPAIGTCERIVTVCAGPKNADTQLSDASTPIDLPDRGRRNQQQRERGANQIARDQRRLDRPAIDEHAGDRADEDDRQHVGDLQPGQLRRRAVHAERHHGDHREQREEVAEQADDLRVPDAAHHVMRSTSRKDRGTGG